VAQQFSGQVFLLDLPGSSIAEAVADVDRVGKLTNALRFAESDKRSATADLRVRRQDVESGQKAVDLYSGVDAIVADVVKVESLIGDAQKLAIDVRVATNLRARAHAAEKEIGALAKSREVRVPAASLVEAARSAGLEAAEMVALRARIKRARVVLDALSGVRGIQVPPEPTGAKNARDALVEARLLRARLQGAKAASRRMQGVAEALNGAALEQVAEMVAKASKVSKTLDVVVSLRERRATSQNDIGLMKTQLQTRAQQLATAEAEVRAILDEMGACPVCLSVNPGSHAHEA
jgi:hypothetical protein